MKKPLLLLCLCLSLVVVVGAGCGSDDEEEGGAGQSSEQPSEPAGGGGGGGSKPVAVSLRTIAFNPPDVRVKKGGTVTWTNDEPVGHDVTKEGGPGPDFSSGEPGGMQEGDTFKHKFDMAGEFEYVCTVHSNMRGTVTVQ